MPGPDEEEQPPVAEAPKELSESEQMQIIPPPKPHQHVLLRKAAKELPHLLIHKPHNLYCSICMQAKARERPHRKGAASQSKDVQAATSFGDSCTGDFIIEQRGEKDAETGEKMMRGVGGFKDALNLRDIGTGVKMWQPRVLTYSLDSRRQGSRSPTR